MGQLDGEPLYTLRIETTEGPITQAGMTEASAEVALAEARGRAWFVSGSITEDDS